MAPVDSCRVVEPSLSSAVAGSGMYGSLAALMLVEPPAEGMLVAATAGAASLFAFARTWASSASSVRAPAGGGSAYPPQSMPGVPPGAGRRRAAVAEDQASAADWGPRLGEEGGAGPGEVPPPPPGAARRASPPETDGEVRGLCDPG